MRVADTLPIGFLLCTVACGDAFDASQANASPEIRIITDQVEFEGVTYGTVEELNVALEELPNPAISIVVGKCANPTQVKEVMDLLVARGQYNVAISTVAEGCP